MLACLFIFLQENFVSYIPFLLYINLGSFMHVGILIAQGTECMHTVKHMIQSIPQ